MTIRLSLDCPHCKRSVTLDVGAKVVGFDGGGLRTVVAATPVPAKSPKSVCACGHGREWHGIGDGSGLGACIYGHDTLAGGCDCPGYHGRRRASPVRPVVSNPEALSSSQRRLLLAIVQRTMLLEPLPTREDLTVMTGYARSTRDRLIQELKRRFLLSEAPSGVLSAHPLLFDSPRKASTG